MARTTIDEKANTDMSKGLDVIFFREKNEHGKYLCMKIHKNWKELPSVYDITKIIGKHKSHVNATISNGNGSEIKINYCRDAKNLLREIRNYYNSLN